MAPDGGLLVWDRNGNGSIDDGTELFGNDSLYSGRARRRNLRGAFRVTDDADLGGTTVLLVDDVFTTGATVTDCCRALRRAGAARIEVFALSRSVVY